MSMIIRRRAGRAGSMGAALALVVGVLFVASPAQAAPVIELSASDTAVAPGESVTLSWTTADAVSVEASGDWSGPRGLAGSEDVTPGGVGTYVYTLTASDGEEPDASDSVTVTVSNDPITPAPVTFPDECTVVVPDTANVTYYVDYGDDVEELSAGTYVAEDFYTEGGSVTLYVEAAEGFELADGAVTEWEYTAGEECFDSGVELVTTDISCGTVDFANVSGVELEVLYGDEFEEREDGSFVLAPGASYSLSTDREELLYIAYANDEEGLFQIDRLDVPQACDIDGDGDGADDDDADGDGADHPTVAPAAGL